MWPMLEDGEQRDSSHPVDKARNFGEDYYGASMEFGDRGTTFALLCEWQRYAYDLRVSEGWDSVGRDITGGPAEPDCNPRAWLQA